jgi:P pilus assembly chaperone PapD
MRIVTILAAAGVAAGLSHSWAGSLAVSPVRVELTNTERTAVNTVENHRAVARLYQLEAVAWTQSGGEDVYAPTRELIVVPPVFRLAAGQNQIVRLGTQARSSSASGPTVCSFRNCRPNATLPLAARPACRSCFGWAFKC